MPGIERTEVRIGDRLTRRLVWRVRLLDGAPLGVTLAGPAYRDTPILYVNRRFREATGYGMEDLRGENPRLLQGPATEADAVADLREAVDIWEPVTVELNLPASAVGSVVQSGPFGSRT